MEKSRRKFILGLVTLVVIIVPNVVQMIRTDLWLHGAIAALGLIAGIFLYRNYRMARRKTEQEQ